jgi:hypothetical protein
MSDDKERRIRERAYRIWEDEGRPFAKDKEHWERARAEIEEEANMRQGDQEAALAAGCLRGCALSLYFLYASSA